VLAWSALLIIMMAAGMSRSHPAQAETRIASSTTGITLADTVSVAAVSVRAVSPATRYAVQPGDTLGRAPARGQPAGGGARIVLADYDRVVVTCSTRDGTVYVLRPPGGDPRAILRAARLVLPEWSYGELADQLGVPAAWPMEDEPGMPASWAAE